MSDNTIGVDEYRKLLAAEGTRGNKYGAVAVIDAVYGRFDSTGEHRRWYELLTLQGQGAIADLRRQVPYPLIVNGTTVGKYVSDFSYHEDGALVIEDYKGARTSVYRLKARLMLACYGIVIRETGR